MIVWCAWFAEYLIGMELVTNRPHKAMYRLKVKNQWRQEHSRKLIHVDTRAAADYTCTFAPEEVQSVWLIDSLSEDCFFKINGSASDQYQVGHFKGKKTGNAMMFLWKESTPILEIVLPDRTLYANSKEREETEEWYRQLKILFTNSKNSFIIG